MDSEELEAHILRLPRLFTILNNAQLLLAIAVLSLSAFCEHIFSYQTHIYAVCVSLGTIGITIYYLVASTATPKSYNCVALLVLEALAVVLWLETWTGFVVLFVYFRSGGYGYYYYGSSYMACLIAATACGVTNFILYIITLVYLSLTLHRHLKLNQPIRAGPLESDEPGYSSTCTASATAAPQHEMSDRSAPMQPNQEYYAPPRNLGPLPSEIGVETHGTMRKVSAERC